MTFVQIYLLGLAAIMTMMLVLWLVSIMITNVSIVDLFWGMGFVVASLVYFLLSEGNGVRKILILCLVCIWGLRLSVYLYIRNKGKGEDFRYQEFRRTYGPHRYWWVSLFQTFILQGLLMWLVSAPLMGTHYNSYGHKLNDLNILDLAGVLFWLVGFIFEAGGDLQLTRFKKNPANKGKVIDKGFWRYTRHPNYFGDAAVWIGYALLCLASGSYLPVLGSGIMIFLLLKISGVALLEKSLMQSKPAYREYAEKTSAFLPWFPKKKQVE